MRQLLNETDVRRIAIYSRDELKQFHMRSEFGDDSRLRWFIGDIRDRDRLVRAMHGVDYVVHAAALKQVDTGEYNPMEFIKTNVLGSQNVIDAAIETGKVHTVGIRAGKKIAETTRYTDFWVKIQGKWLLLAEHSSFITNP